MNSWYRKGEWHWRQRTWWMERLAWESNLAFQPSMCCWTHVRRSSEACFLDQEMKTGRPSCLALDESRLWWRISCTWWIVCGLVFVLKKMEDLWTLIFLAGVLGIVFKTGLNGGSLAGVDSAKYDKVVSKEKMGYGRWVTSYFDSFEIFWHSFQRKSRYRILAPSMKRKGERGLLCWSPLLDVNFPKGCVEITCLFSPWLFTYYFSLKKKIADMRIGVLLGC